MQDLEIQQSVFAIGPLLTRHGRHTGKAATRVAVYMVNEGPIARRTAAQSAPASDAGR